MLFSLIELLHQPHRYTKYKHFDMINATQSHITTIAHSAAQAKVVSTPLLYLSALVTSIGKYSAIYSPISPIRTKIALHRRNAIFIENLIF